MINKQTLQSTQMSFAQIRLTILIFLHKFMDLFPKSPKLQKIHNTTTVMPTIEFKNTKKFQHFILEKNNVSFLFYIIMVLW